MWKKIEIKICMKNRKIRLTRLHLPYFILTYPYVLLSWRKRSEITCWHLQGFCASVWFFSCVFGFVHVLNPPPPPHHQSLQVGIDFPLLVSFLSITLSVFKCLVSSFTLSGHLLCFVLFLFLHVFCHDLVNLLNVYVSVTQPGLLSFRPCSTSS